jgi:hypothetical protein
MMRIEAARDIGALDPRPVPRPPDRVSAALATRSLSGVRCLSPHTPNQLREFPHVGSRTE